MNDSVLSVKTGEERTNEACISTLIQQPCCVGNEISRLEQSRFPHCREVRDVCKIVNGAPLSASLTKTTYPNLCARVKPALRKNDQSALCVIVILELAL